MAQSVAILFLLGLCALVALPIYVVKLRRARRNLAQATAERDELKQRADWLQQFEVVGNATEEAQRLEKEARDKAAALLAQADKEIADKRAEVRDIRDKAQAVLDKAAAEYQHTIAEAKAQAEAIAGDALKAQGRAREYATAAQAMKNIIEGYGDAYVMPGRSLLDELAEDFGHKDAGVRLKEARDHSRAMVKNNIAATCDYVEANRQTTAILFVLDAFNGKVDTALSKLRHDNYGKLRQEILDAFALVNHNGSPFRNARIEPSYLNARLAELEWAVRVNELKQQEREEQRRIQEAMREEEKARRDYERAIKQAEKEETMLQKAMEQARAELEAAKANERQVLEEKIKALQEQLAAAEAQSQRAISMAEQTRRGHVYIISNIGSFGEEVLKVGLTRRLDPLDRVKELGDASVPFPFDVHAVIYSEDAPALENQMHKRFDVQRVNKVNTRKEFFRVQLRQLREMLDDMKIEAHWTMKAEAQEYRETQALEAAAARAAEPEAKVSESPAQASIHEAMALVQ